jgi:hypothetical protein
MRLQQLPYASENLQRTKEDYLRLNSQLSKLLSRL